MWNFLKNNWFKLGILIFVGAAVVMAIYFCFLYLPSIKTSQNINTQSAININDAQFLQSVIGQLISGNLGYLGIAVTILLVLGYAFTYFNIKPFRESL